MIKIFKVVVLLLSLSLSTNAQDNINDEIEIDKDYIIDTIVENSNIEELRNSEGLIPIDDFTSLLSVSKEGEPSYILSKFILNTYIMKFYLIPNIRATDIDVFKEELNRSFFSGLEEFKLTVDRSDLINFCEEQKDSILMQFDITIKKEYLDEDRNFLFSTVVNSQRCKTLIL